METLNQVSLAAEPLSAGMLLSKREDGDRAEEIRVEIAAGEVFSGMLKQAREENPSPFFPMMMP